MKLCKAYLRRIKAFFLDVQKTYDTVWWDGLWLKLWEVGAKGGMLRVIKREVRV